MSNSLFDLTNEVAVVIGATGVLAVRWPMASPRGREDRGARPECRARQARVEAIRAAGGTAEFFARTRWTRRACTMRTRR